MKKNIIVILLITLSSTVFAGVYSSTSAPFVLNTFSFGSDAATSSAFLLNTFDIATTTIGDEESPGFILDTGGQQVLTTGTIAGYVTSAATGNTIPNATITVWGGMTDNADGNGYYEINNIAPGLGYIVTCSACGYGVNVQYNIQVLAGSNTNINFSLQPIVQNVELVNLSPNPNPVISEVMDGGKLYRYYLIRCENVPYSPASNVPVKLNTGEYFYSDQDGIVAIELEDDYIGNGQPGAEEVFSIVEVNYQSIPVNERETFTARVVDREYSRSWVNSAYTKLGVGITSLPSLAVEREEGAEVKIIERQADAYEGDSLFVNRQARSTGAVEWGVSTPLQVTVNDVQLGASAGYEVGLSVLTDDAYQFDYQEIEEIEACAEFILFADGMMSSIDQTLIDLLAQLEEWFTSQTTLEEAYKYDSKAFDISGGMNASGGIGGLALPLPAAWNVSGSIGVGAHGTMKYTHLNDAPENIVSASLTASGAAGGYAGMIWNNPFPNSVYTQQFQNQIGLSASGTFGAEFSTTINRNTGEWKEFNLLLSRNTMVNDIGQEYKNDYKIEGQNAFNSLENDFPLINGLGDIYQSGGCCGVNTITFNDILFNGFNQLGQLQETSNDPPIVTYEKDYSDIETLSSFNVEITAPTFVTPLSGTVGAGGSLTQYDNNKLEKGTWYKGKHLPTEVYSDKPEIDLNYDDVVNRIVDLVPDAVITAAYILQVLSFIFDDYLFDLGNGSSIYFSGVSLPAGLDTINVATWGWWGADRSRLPSHLSPRVRDIRSRIRDEARDIYGMEYGIGGFYQFEPLGTQLLDSVSLTIAYTDSEIVGINESTLRMYWEDKQNHRWVLAGGTVNAANNTVTATIPALQVYTLAPTLPAGRFSLYPNPSSIPADSSTICTITSGVIYNNDGTIANDGDLFTVSTSSGQIISQDADTSRTGIQVTASGGHIQFDLIAWNIAYDAVVTAVSVYGTAEADTSVDFSDTIIPAAPIISDAIGCGESILVTWLPNQENDLAGYKIYYDSDESGPPYNGIATIFGNPSPVIVGLDTSRTLLGLFNDSTYYISITAYDIEGNESDFSEELITTPELPPALPQKIENLSLSMNGNNVILSWSPVYSNTGGDSIQISHYVIYRSLTDPYFEPTSMDSIGFVLHPNNTFIDSEAIINTKAFYNVRVFEEINGMILNPSNNNKAKKNNN